MASIYVRCGNTQPTNLKCNDTEQAYQITEEENAPRETRAGRRSGTTSRITSRDVKPLFLLLRANISVIHTIVLLALCWCPRVIGYREQRFAIEPQDQPFKGKIDRQTDRRPRLNNKTPLVYFDNGTLEMVRLRHPFVCLLEVYFSQYIIENLYHYNKLVMYTRQLH
ncbi:hypothetical protein EVAR_4598_1 [Eumeta japonica]|uniref:Uncharacterized protein n=1 Tax=Eumeta variegata TaxID=151549 RepID=A0A4C1SX04_EUMVA|nr:hypothetical protein EVAR_4598_1 [Eumeta japonica]